MRSQLLRIWDRVRTSFWFLPSLMAAGAVAVAFGAVALDRSLPVGWLRTHRWAYTGGAEGASAVLSTVAGSMITIAGVVFSLTLVALSLASSQFGPRLLRNFMRDTANQMVLGTFVGTFLYCLLVLRTIRRDEAAVFVPHLSVTLGVLFATASLGVLIYFIHHVSVSIQADDLVARVGLELVEGIDHQFPAHRRGGIPATLDHADAGLKQFEREARPVWAGADGYVQRVDLDALAELGTEADVVIRVERRPGQYIVCGGPLAAVRPGDRLTDPLAARVNAAFALGTQRTPAQDIEFAVNQLVEVAVRALSPGVNDPFTAIACVDRLGSALFRLAQRDMPSPYRLDEENRLRLVTSPVTFRELVGAAFDPIRRHARPNVAVTLRLLETLAVVAGATREADQRAALRRQAEMIVRGAREAVPEAEDRQAVEASFQATSRALNEPGASPD